MVGCRIGEAIGITVDQLDTDRKVWIKGIVDQAEEAAHRPVAARGAGDCQGVAGSAAAQI